MRPRRLQLLALLLALLPPTVRTRGHVSGGGQEGAVLAKDVAEESARELDLASVIERGLGRPEVWV